MKQPAGYLTFLIALQDELAEALREAEDQGWHHAPASQFEAKHYNRLLTWLDQLKNRKAWYDSVKAR